VAGSRSRGRRGKLIPFAGFAALFPEAIDFAGLVIGRFIGKLTAPMSVGFASRTLPIARFAGVSLVDPYAAVRLSAAASDEVTSAIGLLELSRSGQTRPGVQSQPRMRSTAFRRGGTPAIPHW
jgi:hypothetical protein